MSTRPWKARTEQELIHHLLTNVWIDRVTGCWYWIGSCNTTGYANLTYRGKVRLCRNLLFELLTGRKRLWGSRYNLHLRHTCDEPRCIYPLHAIVGTVRDNVQDSIMRGRRNAIAHNDSLRGKKRPPEVGQRISATKQFKAFVTRLQKKWQQRQLQKQGA